MTIPVFRDPVQASNTYSLTPAAPQSWADFTDGIRFLALRALGDPDGADDVVQETLLRALRSVENAGNVPIRNPAAFIHGIARHVIADALRGKYKTVPLEGNDATSAPDANVLDVMVSEEERARVMVAIRKLPQDERALLVMSFVHGMTSPEIAAKLGESADRIRKRKSRAVQRLREAFFAD